jgi:hypothetical protein
LAYWVRKHWTRMAAGGFYIGPDAQRLVRVESAELAYFPPGMPIEPL